MGIEAAEKPARYFIGFSLRNAVTLCFYVQCLGFQMINSTRHGWQHGWFKNVWYGFRLRDTTFDKFQTHICSLSTRVFAAPIQGHEFGPLGAGTIRPLSAARTHLNLGFRSGVHQYKIYKERITQSNLLYAHICI